MYIYTHIYIYVYIHIYIYVFIHTCKCIGKPVSLLHTLLRYIHTQTLTQKLAHTRACTNNNTFGYIFTCVIHTQTYTHTHTHTQNTYTLIYIYVYVYIYITYVSLAHILLCTMQTRTHTLAYEHTLKGTKLERICSCFFF